jgi:hypothetical protein
MRVFTTRALALVLTGGLLLAGAGLLPLAGDGLVPMAQAQEKKEKKERHPHIHAAIRELREAKKELEEAAHDFGGHRKEAIEAIDVAIKQLQQALKFDKK